MKVAVIKYNAGNIGSIRNALGRLGIEAVVTDVEDQIRSADRVIFPGVGEASSAMASLAAKGLDKVLADYRQFVALGFQGGMAAKARLVAMTMKALRNPAEPT